MRNQYFAAKILRINILTRRSPAISLILKILARNRGADTVGHKTKRILDHRSGLGFLMTRTRCASTTSVDRWSLSCSCLEIIPRAIGRRSRSLSYFTSTVTPLSLRSISNPESGACVGHTTVCSRDALKEFCSNLVDRCNWSNSGRSRPGIHTTD